MRITFDDELDEADQPGEPSVTIDDIRDAQRAAAFCRRSLAEAVADVQALDGLSGWVSWLTGNHETDLERALAVVKDRRHKLALADAHLDRMKRTMAEDADRARATQEIEVQRLIELEMAADRLRDRGDATAAHLVDLEDRIATHRSLAQDYEAVFASGMAVRGQLNRALQHLTSADFGATIDTYGGGTGSALKLLAMRNVKQAIEGLPERMSRFQQVCEVIGLSVRLGDGLEKIDTASRATMTDMVFEGFFTDLLTARKITDAKYGLESMKADVERAIEPVVAKRKQNADVVERLEREREAFLSEHRA